MPLERGQVPTPSRVRSWSRSECPFACAPHSPFGLTERWCGYFWGFTVQPSRNSGYAETASAQVNCRTGVDLCSLAPQIGIVPEINCPGHFCLAHGLKSKGAPKGTLSFFRDACTSDVAAADIVDMTHENVWLV